MADFFDRLKQYYIKAAEVLKGQASPTDIFKNTTDKGMSREAFYAEFLKQHIPSKCNIFFGGFLFSEDGRESKQLDIIITNDTAPRFLFGNNTKSFSPVEGTLGVVSVKSKLDKKELLDSLEGFASVPMNKPLEKGKISPVFKYDKYTEWPYKIIYANDGLTLDTINGHVLDFYKENPEIPIERRPNIIHVAGKYVFIKSNGDTYGLDKTTGERIKMSNGQYFFTDYESDLEALIWIFDNLQKMATASSHIIFNYSWITNKVRGVDRNPTRDENVI